MGVFSPSCPICLRPFYSGNGDEMCYPCRKRLRGLPSSLKGQTGVSQQPAPKGSGEPIADLVVKDLMARKAFGTKKYGEPLKAHNGRSALQDLYEELLDACQYIRQLIEENK